jgi:hypothetical protein
MIRQRQIVMFVLYLWGNKHRFLYFSVLVNEIYKSRFRIDFHETITKANKCQQEVFKIRPTHRDYETGNSCISWYCIMVRNFLFKSASFGDLCSHTCCLQVVKPCTALWGCSMVVAHSSPCHALVCGQGNKRLNCKTTKGTSNCH